MICFRDTKQIIYSMGIENTKVLTLERTKELLSSSSLFTDWRDSNTGLCSFQIDCKPDVYTITWKTHLELQLVPIGYLHYPKIDRLLTGYIIGEKTEKAKELWKSVYSNTEECYSLGDDTKTQYENLIRIISR